MTPRHRRLLAHLGCCLLVAIALVGCRDFPSDFDSLPLEDKISTYERWMEQTGHPHDEAQTWISWHGLPAADAMVPYLYGQKVGIPKYEALHLIWYVQLRGCSLLGTEAEQAVQDYLNAEPAPGNPDLANRVNVRLAESVLDAIRLDGHVEKFDSLPPGPCSVQ